MPEVRTRAGATLTYDVHGPHGAPPLLLVRPLGGTVELWGAFRDVLARRFRVVAFDAAGTGRSGGTPRRSTRQMADDARDVLDASGLGRAHLFGISLGGMVATWLAGDSADRIDRVVFASTAARGNAAAHGSAARALSLARCFLNGGSCVETCLTRRVLSKHFRREHPDEVRRIEAIVARSAASRSALLAHVVAGALHDGRAPLARIVAPTLVLAGGRDALFGASSGEDVAAAVAGARREVFEMAGHDLTLEEPIRTAERVAAFLIPS